MFGLFKKKKETKTPNISTEFLGTMMMNCHNILFDTCEKVVVAIYRDYDVDSKKSLNVYVKRGGRIAYRFNPDVWDAEKKLIDL